MVDLSPLPPLNRPAEPNTVRWYLVFTMRQCWRHPERAPAFLDRMFPGRFFNVLVALREDEPQLFQSPWPRPATNNGA